MQAALVILLYVAFRGYPAFIAEINKKDQSWVRYLLLKFLLLTQALLFQ